MGHLCPWLLEIRVFGTLFKLTLFSCLGHDFEEFILQDLSKKGLHFAI